MDLTKLPLYLPAMSAERVIVRPFTLEDLEEVHGVMDMDALREPAGQARLTRSQRWDWLQWTVAGYLQFALLNQPPFGDRAIVLRNTGSMIGVCGLVPSVWPVSPAGGEVVDANPARTAEMGLYWAIAREHRGQGYASEAARLLIQYAFETLHLHRIVATTERSNRASQGVMRTLGMRIEEYPGANPPWFQLIGIIDHPRFA
ncbi:MAG: GNAT family N-acetyltransferase [Chloroflexota bacterium]